MGAIDAWIASVLTAHGIDLLRLEAGYQRVVLALLKELEKELSSLLTGSKPLTEFSRMRLTDMLNEARSVIAQTYVDIAATVDPAPIAKMEAGFTARTLQQAVGVKLVNALPSAAMLKAAADRSLVFGAPADAWWKRQADETAFKFGSTVRQGITQGQTNAQIVKTVRSDVMQVRQRDAEALVRTSVQSIAMGARDMVLEENADILDGVEQLSTLDSRTSKVCVAYDGARWKLDKARTPIAPNKLPFNGGPPRHWQCRSSLTPVVSPLVAGMPGFEPSTRASKGGPTTAKTFTDWLDGQPKATQNELLGAGRADLFRAGKITLPQLLDQSGRPLTLAQLEERYA